VTRAFLEAVLAFYKKRSGVSGCVAVVQRTSSDLKLNPHVHAVFLDGGYVEREGAYEFRALAHLPGSDVAEVLARARRRIERLLARADAHRDDDEVQVMLTSVSGQPPAGPVFRRGASPSGATFSKAELCAQDEGFNLHAATRAGALDAQGRETLLRYILRPPIAQERIQHGPDNLVRIAFKRPFSDGTVAVDMDPLSLLLRLCAAVPAPRFHTVRYAGVLAARSKVRPHIVRTRDDDDDDVGDGDGDDEHVKKGSRYWPWAELMARTFGADVEKCPRCGEHMKLVALVQEKKNVVRFLRRLGEPSDVPERASARAPPYYRSPIIRRLTSGDIAAA
jgi:hypothetical protein